MVPSFATHIPLMRECPSSSMHVTSAPSVLTQRRGVPMAAEAERTPGGSSARATATEATSSQTQHATSTSCSTFACSAQDDSAAPSGDVTVAAPKAEVFSWAIANLEEELYDTHRSVWPRPVYCLGTTGSLPLLLEGHTLQKLGG